MEQKGEMPPPTSTAAAPTGGDAGEPPLTKEEKINIEREQEQKLKAKFPQVARPGAPHASGAGGGGHSAFLQKRLAKGQKFFDSGDYQMAKQKSRGPPGGPLGRMAIPILAQPPTGDAIPTPDTVPARKTSIIQPLYDHSQSMHLASDPAHIPVPGSLPGTGPSGPVPAALAPGQPLPNPAITKLTS